MTPLGNLRREAMEWARDGMAETVIRDRLLDRLGEDDEWTSAALMEWAAKVAADVNAAAVQPSGRASRAPAVLDILQERMPWADLPAEVGYECMNAYVGRMSGIVNRVVLYRRILAILDPAWETQRLATCPTFGEACRVAGVALADVEALAA